MRPATKFVLILLPALLAPEAQACSCMDAGPPCTAFAQTDVVFSGRVTMIMTLDSKVEPGAEYRLERRRVQFLIGRAYRGIQGEQAEVWTGLGGADCGYGFRRGGEYLVYAHRDPRDGRLVTGICGRTRALGDAREDLEYLRAREDPKRGSGIEGQALELGPGAVGDASSVRGPLKGLTVSVSNGTQEWGAVTGKDGRFAIWGLPPGKYTVRAALSRGFVVIVSPDKAELTPGACADVRILVRHEPRA